MASNETVYCICRKPYDENDFMIECEICKDWFHGSCVHIKEHQASDIETYHCPNCQIEHGPLVLKRKRNPHRQDFSLERSGGKRVQTGTLSFIKELKSRHFPLCSEENGTLVHLRGCELTTSYLEENGFDVPILVERPAGLDLIIPPPSFSIQDVENHVGSMREIDVIDVSKQQDYKMLMREWTEYYNSPHRTKIYNVISLEFSNTKLANLVSPPRIVRELSWVHLYWPEQVPEDVVHIKPEVVRYCLMGVKDSFTDFHIDFGGTAVWYHVLRGEKIFYMIPPTAKNLMLYEHWVSSSSQSQSFFGEQVEKCYKLVIKQGQTVFIPTGWIHGVFTPIDSLVFGGNFLHSLDVQLQIQIYDMEKRVQTNNKYMFPNYEVLNWYAAKNILETVKEYKEEDKKPPIHLVEGLKSLLAALKMWTQRKEYCMKENIPETIQCGKLLHEINKVVKLYQHMKGRKKNQKEKKKIQTRTLTDEEDSDEDVNEEDEYVSDEDSDCKPSKANTRSQKNKKKAEKRKSKSMKRKGKTEKKEKRKGKSKKKGGRHKVKHKDDVEIKSEEEREDVKESPITMKISKHRSSSQSRSSFDIYDFKDDPELKSSQPLQPLQPSDKSPSYSNRSPPPASTSKTKGVRITAVKSSPQRHTSDSSPIRRLSTTGDSGSTASTPLSSPTGSASSGRPFLSSPFSGSFSPTAGGQLQSPSWAVSSATSSLMGEAPMTSTLGLKLKLTTNKASNSNRTAIKGSRPQNSIGSDHSQSDDSEADQLVVVENPKKSKGKVNYEDVGDRINMPEIRGGLNGSIADILEASGYGTETDFKVDDEIGDASPNMRDAIQGMLSMSRGSGLTLGANKPSPFENRSKPLHRNQPTRSIPSNQKSPLKKRKMVDDDEIVYKDDDYAYHAIDPNDDVSVFKSKDKSRQDDTWKPNSKVVPNCPKPEREAREGALKESMETVLAATSAKLQRSNSGATSKNSYSGSQPSTSSGAGTSSANQLKRRRPKKGQATAKQRLGKILKIHKLMR